MPADEPILSFDSPQEWERWLAKNHQEPAAVWLRMFKKASGKQTLTYDEALDVALCFGWIDGLMRSYDDESFVQRFTPRRAKSVWSKRNRERIGRLMAAERMMPAGLVQVEAAKKDGRWDEAYDGQKDMEVPEDFVKGISKSKKATAFFESLNKANRYAIAWRLQTARKPETRQRRLEALVQMMKDGRKIHP